MKRDIGLRGSSRRDFIKGVLTASAALGLGPLRALEVLDQMGGSALAADGCVQAQRMVHLVAGNGGLAWFTLLWPAPRAITGYQPGYAYDNPQRAQLIQGVPDGRTLYVRTGPSGKTLWQDYGEKKRVSALLCGTSGMHEDAPVKPSNSNTLPAGVGGPVGVNAGAAAIQAPLKALVPAIGIQHKGKDMPFGRAAGAPAPASVPGAAQMVGLFSSAASRLADRLQSPRNQQLFEQYYKAFLTLSRTADKPTYQRAYSDSKVAVSLLTQDLGSRLAADPAVVARWIGPAVVDDTVKRMAEALLVTANAFKLGLTSLVSIPVFEDDPHSGFADLTRLARIADGTAGALQGFLDELSLVKEPVCSTRALSDNVVLLVSGDLPKTPFAAANWPDAVPGNANWVYLMSQGFVKPGWHGEVRTDGKTFQNPATGKLDASVPEATVTSGALASVLYAVTRGDKRALRDQFTGDIDAIVNTSLIG